MYSNQQIAQMITKFVNDPLALLHALGGYYECPKDKHSKRVGPLVGYAGKYTIPGEADKQYVGDVYANFAIAEQYPVVMKHYAQKLVAKAVNCMRESTLVCGPQMGGVSIGQFTSLIAQLRFACAEKKITRLATPGLREQSEIVLARHTIERGDRVIITEDVLNNFSTTSKTITAIEQTGATVIGICGLLNRSINSEHDTYYKHEGRQIPIFVLVKKPIIEYKQDDPTVVADMAEGNYILKPKDQWNILMEVMEKQVI